VSAAAARTASTTASFAALRSEASAARGVSWSSFSPFSAKCPYAGEPSPACGVSRDARAEGERERFPRISANSPSSLRSLRRREGTPPPGAADDARRAEIAAARSRRAAASAAAAAAAASAPRRSAAQSAACISSDVAGDAAATNSKLEQNGARDVSSRVSSSPGDSGVAASRDAVMKILYPHGVYSP